MRDLQPELLAGIRGEIARMQREFELSAEDRERLRTSLEAMRERINEDVLREIRKSMEDLDLTMPDVDRLMREIFPRIEE